MYVGERGGKFGALTQDHSSIDETYTIWAGKYRRYHGQTPAQRLFDIKTFLLNVRDLFLFAIGSIQGWLLLGRVRPDIVFLKGGFVGVPVGLAAAVRKIPFVTHDSDAIPGLANRVVSRWATLHAVALPAREYQYPRSKTVQVGVLVEPGFTHVSADDQAEFKRQLNIPADRLVLLVTGGSLGAQRLNEAMRDIAPALLNDFEGLQIIHQVGSGKSEVYDEYHHERLDIIEFMRPMYVYTGAADVVVARASGNTVAELGAQAKAVIVVANPLLANGHQLKNAERLVAEGAAVSVHESAEHTDSDQLNIEIRRLLQDVSARKNIANNLHRMTIKDAAHRLSTHLLQLGSDARKGH